MSSKFHEAFYSFAKYYNIAFDFRNVPAECGFLREVFQKHCGRAVGSFIEFGAGPAVHCLEMAKTLSHVSAVDLSPEMTSYAVAKGLEAGVQIEGICADMIHFKSAKTYDLATLLMDSSSYLLTNDDVIAHLRSVAEVLNAGGIYLLEMSHPKSVFEIEKVAQSEWEMEKDQIKVKMQWGSKEDHFDPITQITQVSVRLDFEDHGKVGTVLDRSAQRCFTATEFAALVAASGVFKIVEWYGSMSSAIPFSSAEEAWRMIPVLQKI